MMSNEEIAAIVRAKMEDKTIQMLLNNNWKDIQDTVPIANYNFYHYQYRIKPREPRVIYVNLYNTNVDTNGYAYYDKDRAKDRCGNSAIGTAVKFVEIIE